MAEIKDLQTTLLKLGESIDRNSVSETVGQVTTGALNASDIPRSSIGQSLVHKCNRPSSAVLMCRRPNTQVIRPLSACYPTGNAMQRDGKLTNMTLNSLAEVKAYWATRAKPAGKNTTDVNIGSQIRAEISVDVGHTPKCKNAYN